MLGVMMLPFGCLWRYPVVVGQNRLSVKASSRGAAAHSSRHLLGKGWLMKHWHARGASGVLATCVLLVCLTACDESGPEAIPSPSATLTSPPSTPTNPTPSPSWQDAYTADELRAYGEALDRWSDYEQESEPVWATGQMTDAASAVFQEYFVSPVWQQYLHRLQTYESADVKVTGLPTVFWSKATRIRTSESGGSVTVQQCVDYKTQVVTQAGRPIKAIPEPVLRTATADQVDGNQWLLLRIREPSTEKYQPCSQEAP